MAFSELPPPSGTTILSVGIALFVTAMLLKDIRRFAS